MTTNDASVGVTAAVENLMEEHHGDPCLSTSTLISPHIDTPEEDTIRQEDTLAPQVDRIVTFGQAKDTKMDVNDGVEETYKNKSLMALVDTINHAEPLVKKFTLYQLGATPKGDFYWDPLMYLLELITHLVGAKLSIGKVGVCVVYKTLHVE
jgi:hypothetical protein